MRELSQCCHNRVHTFDLVRFATYNSIQCLSLRCRIIGPEHEMVIYARRLVRAFCLTYQVDNLLTLIVFSNPRQLKVATKRGLRTVLLQYLLCTDSGSFEYTRRTECSG